MNSGQDLIEVIGYSNVFFSQIRKFEGGRLES